MRKVRATADALAAYQKSIGATQEAIATAHEIRMRCERRMGEELQAGQERGEIARAGGDHTSIVPDGNNAPATLEELGFHGSAGRKEAASFKALAKPTAEQFEAIVDEAKTGKVSQTTVIQVARAAVAKKLTPANIKREMMVAPRAAHRRTIEAEPTPPSRSPPSRSTTTPTKCSNRRLTLRMLPNAVQLVVVGQFIF